MTPRVHLPGRLPIAVVVLLSAAGCQIPTHAERGALFGGLTGAGAGALVGNAVGSTGAGAVLGAGLGALTGTVVGQSLDDVEARNRAEIEARLGRAVPAGTVTTEDVVAMTKAGVDPEVIANHVRYNGVIAPPTAADLIRLNEQGVDPRVVQAMQTPRQPPAGSVVGPPVVVEEHYYGPPCYYYPCRPYHCYRRPRSHVSWGVSFGTGGCP